MTITIAPIAESHAEGFHACLDAVAREQKYLAQIEAPPLERLRGFVRDGVSANAAQFVAMDEGRVVGWCDIFPAWAHAVQHCGTLGMGVLADYRGRGIGQRLLSATLAKAQANGITGCTSAWALFTRRANATRCALTACISTRCR